MNKIVVIDVGHSAADKGAHSKMLNLSEWTFNKELAETLHAVGWWKSQIVYRTAGIGELVSRINKINPAFVLSLHCNAATNPQATGTECLYWHSSEKSKKAASILQDRLVHALGLKDRGIKPKTAADRGGFQLQKTNAPMVLIEPFFLSNIQDVTRAREKYPEFVDALLKGVDEILQEVV
jgi:N-acetylmuramoyl-L-alanine amidase